MKLDRVTFWTGARPPGPFVNLWAIRNKRFTRAASAVLMRFPHGTASTRSSRCFHHHTVMVYEDAMAAGLVARGRGFHFPAVLIAHWPNQEPAHFSGEPDL